MLNTPPSYTLPCGPGIDPFQINRLSPDGWRVIGPMSSFFRSAISRWIRLTVIWNQGQTQCKARTGVGYLLQWRDLGPWSWGWCGVVQTTCGVQMIVDRSCARDCESDHGMWLRDRWKNAYRHYYSSRRREFTRTIASRSQFSPPFGPTGIDCYIICQGKRSAPSWHTVEIAFVLLLSQVSCRWQIRADGNIFFRPNWIVKAKILVQSTTPKLDATIGLIQCQSMETKTIGSFINSSFGCWFRLTGSSKRKSW